MENILYVERKDIEDFICSDDILFIGKDHAEFPPMVESIMNNIQVGPRSELESDPSKKQIIPYIVITKNLCKQVFMTRRLSSQTEKRLRGSYSLGVGGHAEEVDMGGDFIFNAAIRELNEEVCVENVEHMKRVGFINNDTDSVGKVHLGVIYHISCEDVSVREKDKMSGGWVKWVDVSRFNMEVWSKMIAGIQAQLSSDSFPHVYNPINGECY